MPDDEHIWGNIVTPERLAKGDLSYSVSARGWIDAAHSGNSSILSILNQHRRLEAWTVTTATTYLDWRAAFLAPVDPTSIHHHEGRGAAQEVTKYDRYFRLLRTLPIHTLARIDVACEPYPTKRDRDGALDDTLPYREAFELLAAAIDDVRDWAKNLEERLQKTLAPSPES